MAPARRPPAKQMLLPDVLVAADQPTYGEWCSLAPDDSCDPNPTSDNISAGGLAFANSCFKDKIFYLKKEDGNFVYSAPMGTISWTNDHCPQVDVVLSDSDLPSPQIKFDEIIVIGEGNFGAVFKARNKQDNKFYAIKRIKEELEDGKKREKAMKEVDIWKSLGTHENIVELISHWIEGDNLYIQMELCEYCLSEKRKHFDYGETKKLLYQLSNVLEFIHGRHIAHVDVKPANIYLSNGVYKVGDFGCAASTCSEQPIERGDDRYMPDEMLNGRYKDLEKVDVFSLGASCYELITGDDVNPRAGDLELPSEFPEEFGYLIKSMRDADPEKRPSLKAIISHSIFDEFRKDVAK